MRPPAGTWHHYRKVEVPPLKSYERMLPAIFRLEAPGPNGTVEDVEAICVGVIGEYINRAGAEAGWLDRQEALGFLLGEAVVLHGKYDPAKRHGSGSFEGYLYDRLRFRLIDYLRKWYGRHGQWREWASLDDGDAGRARLELPGDHRDDPASGATALGGLLALGDREAARPLGGPDHPARGGAGGGTAASDRPTRGGASGTSGPAPFYDCESCGWRTYIQAPNGVDRWHVPDFCSACNAPLALALTWSRPPVAA